MKNPIVELCKIIPIKTTELTDEFLDLLHETVSALGIHHSKDRCEIFNVFKGPLVEMGIVEIINEDAKNNNRIYFKCGKTTEEVIQHYVRR